MTEKERDYIYGAIWTLLFGIGVYATLIIWGIESLKGG